MALLVLLAVCLAMPRGLGFAFVLDRVSDHEHRVSLDVPDGWRFEAPANGGSMTTDGGSSGESEPYRVSDLHVVSWVTAGVDFFDVYIYSMGAGSTQLLDAQSGFAQEACALYGGCDEVSAIHRTTVDGHAAVDQVLRVNQSDRLFLGTVIAGGLVIRFQGFSDSGILGSSSAAWRSIKV